MVEVNHVDAKRKRNTVNTIQYLVNRLKINCIFVNFVHSYNNYAGDQNLCLTLFIDAVNSGFKNQLKFVI